MVIAATRHSKRRYWPNDEVIMSTSAASITRLIHLSICSCISPCAMHHHHRHRQISSSPRLSSEMKNSDARPRLLLVVGGRVAAWWTTQAARVLFIISLPSARLSFSREFGVGSSLSLYCQTRAPLSMFYLVLHKRLRLGKMLLFIFNIADSLGFPDSSSCQRLTVWHY